MSTQGAVQLDVTINGQSFTALKDHAVSLSIRRVIGDAADEFTLEAFDETAWRLENALMGSELAPVTIRYSASNTLKKTLIFSGICLDYQISFVGLATVLSITGILSTSEEDTTGFWFDRRAIEWVGQTKPIYADGEDKTVIGYICDGKSAAEYSNYEKNEDVCAFVDYDKDSGIPITYYNPTRIFKRIIHKYNGDKLGTTSLNVKEVSGTKNVYTRNATQYDGDNGAVINDYSNRIYSRLPEEGFNVVAVCAIMGNIMQESSFNPEAENSSHHYGLCQWSQTYFPQFYHSSFEYQRTHMADWIKSEYNSFYYKYKSNYKLSDFMNASSIEDATEAFCRVVERCGESEMNLTKRIAYARGYYNHYVTNHGDTDVTVSTVNTITYEADYNGAVEGWGTGGSNGFVIGDCDESRWVQGVPLLQEANETAAQYINRALCKFAVTNTHPNDIYQEVAGFQYYIKNGKHYFKALNYNTSPNSKELITIEYGKQNATVISFSIDKIGVLAMTGVNQVDTSAMNYFTNEGMTEDIFLGYEKKKTDEEESKNSAYENWYFGQFSNVKVASSGVSDELRTQLSSIWNDLQNFCYKANLTVWADGTNKYAPGNYIEVIIMGNGMRHYASGTYYILEINDTISSDGYAQSMVLLKGSDQLGGVAVSDSGLVDNSINDVNGNIISAVSTYSTEADAKKAAEAAEEARQKRVDYLNSLESLEDLKQAEVQKILVTAYEEGWSSKKTQKELDKIDAKYK